MTNTDQSMILAIVNEWQQNLVLDFNEDDDVTSSVKFDLSGKFSKKFTERTGEFLRVTKKLEYSLLNKICESLSVNYTLTEELFDEYLDWCFDNNDYVSKKVGGFNLISIANFAIEWERNKFDSVVKNTSHSDIESVTVKDNFFFYCEKFGIPLASEKLSKEVNGNAEKLKALIISRLTELSKTTEGLNKIRNMLMKSIENSPYKKCMFSNFRIDFAFLFKYFRGEPWTI